jgi:hypothetical protein
MQPEGLERGIGYGTHKVPGANQDHLQHGMNPDAVGSESPRGLRTGYHVSDRFDHGMVPRRIRIGEREMIIIQNSELKTANMIV